MNIWLARGGLAALAVVGLATRATEVRAQGAGAGTMLELPALGVKVTVPTGIGEWIVRHDDGGDVVQRTRPVNPYLSVLFSLPEGKSTGCADTMAAFAKKGLKKLDRPALIPGGWATQVLAANSSGENLLAFCAESDGGGAARQLVALVTYAASVDGPDLTSVTPILEAVGKAVFARKSAAAAPPPANDHGKKPPVDPAAEDTDAYRDTPPQEVTLPRSGLVLLVGGGQAWEARPGKGGRDLVRRTQPEDPTLSVALEIVRSGHDNGGCAAILDQYMATRGKSSLQAKPAYLPGDYHPNAAESYDGGTGRALTCAEVPSGYLLATIAYSGSLDAEDARAARPVLIAALHAATALTTTHKHGRSVLSGHSFYSPELYLAGERTRTNSVASPDGMIGNGLGVAAGVRQAGMLHFSPGSVFGLAGRYQLQGGWDAQNDLFFDGTLAIGIGISIDRVTLMPMVGGGGDAIGAGASKAADKLNLSFDIYDYYGGVIDVELSDLLAIELTGGYCNRGEIRELRYDGKVIALPRSFRKVSLGLSYVDIEKTATLWQLLLGIGF
jgi:hypothetical protein